MLQNLCLVFAATLKIVLQLSVIISIGIVLAKLYEKNEDKIKKHEPAFRQRVHEVAKAINW